MAALNLPTWNQLNDPNPGGQQDPDDESDCGEECASMVLYACVGTYTYEEEVREAMGKIGSSGATTNTDIASYLTAQGCPSVALYPPVGQLKALLKRQLAMRRPTVVLGAWVSPAVLHWVAVVDYGGGRVGYNDPWGGKRLYMPWRWFLDQYRGEIVRVDRDVRA